MNFTQSVSHAFGNYATFKGRASRSEFWYFYLFTYLGSWVLRVLPKLFGLSDLIVLLFSFIGIIFYLVTFIPMLAVSVRRLHDTGRSGIFLIWMGLAIIIGLVVFIVCCINTNPLIQIIGLIVFLVALFGNFYFFAKSGDPEKNRYGECPE